MRETWYILEDGSHGDPRLVALDESGVLRHQNGIAVAFGGHGNPRSIGVDVGVDGLEVGSAPAKAEAKVSPKPSAAKPVKPGKSSAAGYETR